MRKTLIASAIIGLFASNIVMANDETEELRQIIDEQQKVLKKLEKRLDEADQKIEATADQIEANASSVSTSKTSIGGYGEIHYNNYEDKDAKIDFHRFVLFVDHEFNDSIRFYSELEVEHAISGDGEEGAIELEQAFIQVDISEALTSNIGLLLTPVGIINETHEPTTFYGVERNAVEKNIIPTTWREAGVIFNYKVFGGLSFDGAVLSGLNVDTTGSKAYNIRSGRQGVANATAEHLAYSARVNYSAILGLKLGASIQYQSDITQGEVGVDTADATLFEAHAIYQIKKFSIRALYAQWDISGDEAQTLGRDEQMGWYVEPSYKFNEKIGVFARYAEYDNEAGNSVATAVESSSVGINYYLHENVVLKADFEVLGSAEDSKGFNLGIGYQF